MCWGDKMVDVLTVGTLVFVALLIIGFIIYATKRTKKIAAIYQRVAQEKNGEYIGARGNVGDIRISHEHNFRLRVDLGGRIRGTTRFTLLTMDIDPSLSVDIKKKIFGPGLTMDTDTQKVYETLPEDLRADVFDVSNMLLSYIKAENGIFELRLNAKPTTHEELSKLIEVSIRLRNEFERVFKRPQ
jgi:hypothetical protein